MKLIEKEKNFFFFKLGLKKKLNGEYSVRSSILKDFEEYEERGIINSEKLKHTNDDEDSDSHVLI